MSEKTYCALRTCPYGGTPDPDVQCEVEDCPRNTQHGMTGKVVGMVVDLKKMQTTSLVKITGGKADGAMIPQVCKFDDIEDVVRLVREADVVGHPFAITHGMEITLGPKEA